MARGKKKSKNQGNGNNINSNNANVEPLVEQLTKDIKKLSVKGKKKKSPNDQPRGKTPYQGKRQCFGLYECTNCRNDWASSHSWANTWQECLECRSKVYPNRQWPKKQSGKKTGVVNKPHQRNLCEKCIRLGNYCGNR